MEALVSDKVIAKKESKNKYIKKTFPVLGMTCAACAVSVESILKSAKGVHDAGVNYANQTAWAEYEQTVKPVDLQNLIRSVGYDLIVDSDDPQQEQQQAQWGSNSIWTKCIAKHLPLIALSSHSTHFHQNQRSIFLAC
ncbi:cation transporter [Dyadobacter sp. 50-39]|uniref:cation transporter n=1 Tax=Dyadobacter sp. 50-39 TaxID=1895756 RepID=UPI0025C220AE|nr:heavy metal-associated domain-containing protein [Dyadobacter sp. 50-39]